MAVKWKPVLPLITICSLIVFEEWVSTPTCKIIPSSNPSEVIELEEDPDDLKVMMVANLLLLGSEAGYYNYFFRDYYMSKFFRKSFESLKPDLLLVLGDVSAKGSELTKSKWVSVLHQFHEMLGPYVGLPFHVILGDRDIGECSDLNIKAINWKASSFPGLDPSGCGAFEFGNISFVSLNAVALLCSNNNLRFDVEKIIERESVELHMETLGTAESIVKSKIPRDTNYNFPWRESTISTGSGPVLLLHFPLHRTENGNCNGVNAFESTSIPSAEELDTLESRGLAGAGPYNLLHTLPPNATEYIFQALKPRIVFSAHTHEFCDHVHLDGTREVTVPAMTWNARDDPGFIFVTFQRTGRTVSVSYCSIARESQILVAFLFVLVIFFMSLR
ncbi:metallophosphoesterase 1-like isoform X1 [Quillaja saponaria]|uniref:Metallophosphoesterase 1-like isoform X1 n=1 Tax=Quillaja saponaria TaxID=32244 RepID=A0AAD7LKM5_QUISA|nr:metallophosphoesterase 1-like isoform X1 [Quillaja saponaria]